LRKEDGTALVPAVSVALVAFFARFLAAACAALVAFFEAFFEDFVTMADSL
jgi:hypothetical protein